MISQQILEEKIKLLLFFIYSFVPLTVRRFLGKKKKISLILFIIFMYLGIFFIWEYF